MSNDAQWVEDVRRWSHGSGAQPIVISADISADMSAAPEGDPIGYEAAHPSLQARHWPDAPGSNNESLPS